MRRCEATRELIVLILTAKEGTTIYLYGDSVHIHPQSKAYLNLQVDLKQIRFASPVADSHKKCNVFQVTATSRSKKSAVLSLSLINKFTLASHFLFRIV